MKFLLQIKTDCRACLDNILFELHQFVGNDGLYWGMPGDKGYTMVIDSTVDVEKLKQAVTEHPVEIEILEAKEISDDEYYKLAKGFSKYTESLFNIKKK